MKVTAVVSAFDRRLVDIYGQLPGVDAVARLKAVAPVRAAELTIVPLRLPQSRTRPALLGRSIADDNAKAQGHPDTRDGCPRHARL